MNDREIGLLPPFTIELAHYDKAGTLLYTNKEEGHSWTRNAYNLLLTCLLGVGGGGASFGAGYLDLKMTDYHATSQGGISVPQILSFYGVSRYWGNIAERYAEGAIAVGHSIWGASGEGEIGIQVGTGNAAFSFEDINLAARIGSGNGAGQLSYGTSAPVESATWDNALKTFTFVVERYFNNNSGNDITVKESGLVNHFHFTYGYSGAYYSYYFLLARDILTSPITLVDTEQLRITYTFVQTLPE